MESTIRQRSVMLLHHDRLFCGSLQVPSAASPRLLSVSSVPRHALPYSLPMPAAAASPLRHSLTDVQLLSRSLVLEHCRLQVTEQIPCSINQIYTGIHCTSMIAKYSLTIRVWTGPVRGSKTAPDQSRIFFGPMPVRAQHFWQMKYAAKNCAAVWQIEKSHTPDITVGQINSGVARCGWGSWAGHVWVSCTSPEPTAAAYRAHEYNWSITTASALSITLDLGWRLSVQLTVVYIVCSQKPLVLSPSSGPNWTGSNF